MNLGGVMSKIKIYLDKIEKNAKMIKNICDSYNVSINAVTKGVCGDIRITESIIKSGISELADSRIENIRKIRGAGIKSKFMLLRPPSYEKLKDNIDLVDEILISEVETLQKTVDFCEEEGHDLDFIYMIDLGDLREGVWYKNAVEEISYALSVDGGRIVGIGTNLGCYGGVVYTKEKMIELLEIKRKIEKKTSRKLKKISGGSTAALQLLYREELPAEINNFRIGEAILLGTDTTNDVEIEWLNKDTMLFCAEIIELKEKPTVPVGKIGKDAFGRDPVFKDRGIRKKAILDVGEQDIFPSGLKPIDKNIKVIHASGDHLICDVTDCDKELHLGDEIVFRMTYGCMMRAMNSEYIKKIYL